MAVDTFFYEKIKDNFSFEPTPCQNTLFENLARFTMFPIEEDLMIVNGYAGTGKTTAIAAYVKTLKKFSIPFRLMAPTGRSAKVLANYTGEHSYTIHKQIYRQKSLVYGAGAFTLSVNKLKGTIFIVDESSLITIDSQGSAFGSGDLLSDLIEFVRQGDNNRLILIGDNAQLPPISLDESPALDLSYLSSFGSVMYTELRTVVRQAEQSGILYNATILRKAIKEGTECCFDGIQYPKLQLDGFEDVKKITGGELIEALSGSIEKNGLDETVVLCRSNKRANRYNAGIRASILYREEALSRGDKLMVVKNCYQFLDDIENLDFIANGDVAELVKIGKYEERYGLHFAEAVLMFPDYNNVEITAKVILDTLTSESASLSHEQQQQLYEGVFADYDQYKTKRKRNAAVREDVFYNALQIKYATAITCHKSQGGQWHSVFIDNAFWKDELSLDDLKWLYTAITRAFGKVYLVNFSDKFFQ